MSKEIDERVVEMRFDNKQFEANVQTSLSTLDKLKQGLNLEGAAKGLERVGESAKKCDLSKLGSSIEAVHAKFSALEIMAITTLSNITNSAVNAGKRLVSAFTIDPIKTGFNEYELKMGSIQTIMAGTGESLDRVNQKLNELNTYSDKTIYSFADMTQNIGKFTNAGVKLDDAVSAIQGISNAAAVSGANASDASRAMYNFSQALSAGHVKLIDWKSIENANMATVEFKNQLLESAVAVGTLTKSSDGMYRTLAGNALNATKNFNDTLQDQWMTTEVLVGTLNDYADETTAIGKKAFSAAQDVKTFSQMMDTLKESAQSGWAETWQLVVGDFEEAKGTLRQFSEFLGGVIGASADARNSFLEGALTSGWGQLKNRVAEAGFAVDDFQEALRETASGSVAGLDKMIEEAGSFEATLSKGWLTTDILAKTLDKMADNAAGATGGISALTDEQLKNVGYTDEQIQALRKLGDQASTTSGPIADLMDTMARKSGRELLFDSLLNSFKGIQKIFDTLGGAWAEIFPPSTSEQLYGMISAINEFSRKLIISDETADKIRRTFKGLFAVLDIVKQALSAVFEAVKPLFGGLETLGGGILGVTASLGDWLVGLDTIIKKGDLFGKVCGGITGVVETAASAIGAFIKMAKEKFGIPGFELFHKFLDRIQKRMGQVGEAVGGMQSGVVTAVDAMGSALKNSKFLQALQLLWDGVKTVSGGIVKAVGDLVGGIVDKIGAADFSGAIDLLNGISFGGIAIGITKFFNSLSKPLDGVNGLLKKATGILDGVRDCFKAYQTQLQAGTLLKIAGAIAILAASIMVISLIDSNKLSASLGAIAMLFADLMVSMTIFSKISGDIKGVAKSCAAMIAISTAILILASALKKISDLDVGQLAVGLTGIAGLTGMLVAAAKVMGSGSGTMIKGAVQMVIFAGAIQILASVCTDLSGLKWSELAKGLTGVGALMAAVSLFLNTAKFSGKAITTATGIVILASAMKVLASACKDFGQMKWGELAKGLTSVGTLLLAVAAFTRLTGNAKHVLTTGLALIGIAAAMKIFASAMSDFGALDWESITKGLVAMGTALAEIAIATNLMPKNMVGIGVGLIAVGGALEIIANSLGKMGKFSWEEIAKGLVAMGGALAALSIGLNLMNGTLGGSAAMLVAAAALAVLTPVLSILGAMSWESIAKGLVSLAGAFAVIGISGAVLTPLLPTILGLAGAFVLIGASVLGIGVGLLAAGAGLSAIAVGATALAVAFAGGVTGIVAGLTVVITGIASLIPAIVTKIGEAIIAFCNVIAEGAPAIAAAVKAVVLSLVDVLVECVPAIATGVLELVAGVLSALVTYTPQIVDSVMGFLIGVLEGIARNLPKLIQAAVDVFMAFFSGIVDALSGIDTDVLLKGIVGVGLLTALIAGLGFVAGMVPLAMLGVLGMGAIIAELAFVLAAVGALAQIPGLSWLIGEGGKLLQGIGTAIGSFVGGIVGGFMSGVSSQFPKIGTDLTLFMTNVQPFIDGASKISPAMMNGVKALAEVVLLLTAADILDGLTSWFTGGSSLEDFAKELIPFGEAMMDFSVAIAGMDGNLVANAATAGKTLAEMAATLPNSGGVFGFFAGENDMGAFGEQLVPFGKAMKAFSLSVKGMDVTAVTNSATAGKAMVELANTLPNCGGLVSFFTGDNNIADFGDDLVLFGFDLAAYAAAIGSVKPDAVISSANAAGALSSLAAGLPDSSVFDKWFGGDQTLADFGDDIAAFGEDMGYYYSQIANADPSKLSGVINQVWRLVDLAKGTQGLDTSGFQSFGASLNSLAATGLQSFTSVFLNAGSSITNAVSGMIGMVVVAIGNNQPKTTLSMQTLVNALIEAVEERVPRMTATVLTMMTQALSAINGQRYLFVVAGGNVSQGFVDGIRANIAAAASAAAALASAALNAAKAKLEINSPSKAFNTLGMYVDLGLANGISENSYVATNAATGIGSAIVRAFKQRLEISSPSKVTKDEIGRYVVQGIAEGIKEDTSAEEAAKQKAQNIVSAFKTELDKFSLDENTVSLEYELWEKVHGGSSTDSEKEAKELSLLSDKLNLQSQKVGYAQAEYQTTLDQFGQNGENTQEAYNKLLQEQISLADLATQLNQKQASSAERNQQAFGAYADYLRENQEMLMGFGVSLEEIQAAARSQSGYDPTATADYMGLDVEKVVADAMANVQIAYQETAKSTFGTLVAKSGDVGASMATAIGTGIQNGTPKAVKESVSTMVASCTDSITAQSKSWTKAAGVLVDGFILGIKTGTNRAALASGEMAAKVYVSAMEGIASSSTANATLMVTNYVNALKSQAGSWFEIGTVLVMGFVVGIEKNQNLVVQVGISLVTAGANGIVGQSYLWASAATTLVDSFVDGIRSNTERAAQEAAAMAVGAYQSAMTAIGGSATSNLSAGMAAYVTTNENPGVSGIHRVVDMGEVLFKAKTMGSLAGTLAGFTPLGSIVKASTVSATSEPARKAQPIPADKSDTPSNYNFVQNNYSPKALDRTTIYRNTRNQFSQLKGR